MAFQAPDGVRDVRESCSAVSKTFAYVLPGPSVASEGPVPLGGIDESDAVDDLVSDVVLAQGGDVQAFARLVATYQGRLFRLALRTLGDRGEAEDVVQDSFVLAWRRLPDLDTPAAFRGWIFQIVTRQALNAVRARQRRRCDTGGDPAADDPRSTDVLDEGPAEAHQGRALRTDLERALTLLPADLRACWVLRELHGLSYPEIARATALPVSTVRGRIARARHHLATALADWRSEAGRVVLPLVAATAA